MQLYYRFNRTVNFIFWVIVVPLILVILTQPITLPAIYAIQTTVEVQAASHTDVSKQNTADPSLTEYTATIALPAQVKGVGTASNSDYRAVVLDEFFKQNDSPLYGMGSVFVDKCNKYQAPFDCTTLPAIAWVETRLCTLELSHQQQNCWGFGGSGPNRIVFKNYAEAIDLITDRLVNAYGPQYMTNPSSMQHTYCGPHCNTWGPSVQQIRYKISNLAEQMGYPALIKS